jgi:hypothetical protein
MRDGPAVPDLAELVIGLATSGRLPLAHLGYGCAACSAPWLRYAAGRMAALSLLLFIQIL